MSNIPNYETQRLGTYSPVSSAPPPEPLPTYPPHYAINQNPNSYPRDSGVPPQAHLSVPGEQWLSSDQHLYDPRPVSRARTPSPTPTVIEREGERWTSSAPLIRNQGYSSFTPNRENRTPSPTPSEIDALNSDGSIPWKKFKSKDYWLTKEGLITGIVIVIVLAAVILLTAFQDKIVKALSPSMKWLHDQPWGWLVPVGILIVLSFPPLFGHEIVGLLCGIGWGLGVGFAILALGTLLGEIANYFTFRYSCTRAVRKIRKKDLTAACLAEMLHDGGFLVVLAARYSVIPPHRTVFLNKIGHLLNAL
jgi:hypothetical protein